MAAARGTEAVAERAMEVLADPERSFASSAFVRLEILPKALYNRNQAEAEFYEAFFSAVSHWATPADEIVARAYTEAVNAGLSAVDGLHVAAATLVMADEIVTTEKKSKPIHRVKSIPVSTIQPG
jgi:hypothetical protein